MEYGKHLSSSSEGKRIPGLEKKTASKCSILEERKAKEESKKYGINPFPSKGKFLRPSMIPVVKCGKNTCGLKSELTEPKHDIPHNHRQFSSSSKNSSISFTTGIGKRNEELDKKFKLLEEKEKSIADYYFRIENIIRSFVLQKENDKSPKHKTSQYSVARKMTSDHFMFSKTKLSDNILSDLESSVQQISEIWLKTSNDLSHALKNIQNSACLNPRDFEIENGRIQLAIKQAKSLTLVKTRNVIAEAKKLFYNQEIIRRELENFLNYENIKSKSQEDVRKNLEEKKQITVVKSTEKPKFGGTGDSYEEIDRDNPESSKEVTGTEDKEKEKEILKNHLIKLISEGDSFEVEKNSSDETLKEQNESDEFQDSQSRTLTGAEIWMKELAKKNKTITNLNSKIFELQKTCNDQSLKYNQMQVKMAEFHEKIQWNQVLWKQIKKLKEQIKSLQQSNKQFESQKKELESKIIGLYQEVDRLIKMNHLLNQKKYLLKSPGLTGTECKKLEKECTRNRKDEELCKMNENCSDEMETESSTDERILMEKQNAIDQLKTILNAIIDQENFAHKQISVFQSKIEELEKSVKT